MPLLLAMLFAAVAGLLLALQSAGEARPVLDAMVAGQHKIFAYAATLSAGIAILILSASAPAPARASSFAGRCATFGFGCVVLAGAAALQASGKALDHGVTQVAAALESPGNAPRSARQGNSPRLIARTDLTGAPSAARRSAVRIKQNGDRQFRAIVDVNGAGVDMLVDTGASLVLLRPGDARNIGIDIDRLAFSVPVRTANGTAYAARVKLRELRIGPVAVGDVEALIAKPGTLHRSLLGMSFLSRLRSYEFTGRYLTLRM